MSRRLVLLLAASSLTGLLATGAPTPPAGGWAELEAWYEHVGAATSTIALLRLLAVAGAAWLTAAASLQLIACISPRDAIQRWADAISPAALRWMAHGAVSLSVTAGLAVPAISLSPRDDPPGLAVMERLDDEPVTTTTTTTTTTPTTTTTSPPTPTPTVPAPTGEEVVVAPGDSFWSIAVDALVDATGRRPADRDVVGYWQRLIESNRGRLVDPANPDLLFPGQTISVPHHPSGA